MANKRRPKKTKAPYRKYVAGQGFVHTRGFTSTEAVARDEGDSLGGLADQFSELSIGANKIRPANEERSRELHQPALGDGMALPWELFRLILQFSETIEPQYLLVCRTWYFISLSFLYRAPKLSSRNFYKFVDALVNNRKKRLGEHVVTLDLSTIIQSGKNSFVSKLLRRCSPRLETFTAPQTSFGYAPLISLKSCHKLKYLDLGLVSETVQLRELFQAIKGFNCLTHLSFPRSSIDCEGFREFQWPPNLRYLKLSGGITNEFVSETSFPRSIRRLEFSYCPQINEHAVYTVLAKIGDTLTHLYFHYPMPALQESSLDYVFRYCSNLITLQLTVDYCSKWAFSENFLTPLPYPRPLRNLRLECSGSLGQAFKVHPDDLTIAVVEERLPNLKTLRVTSKLGWDMNGDDVGDLVSCLEDQEASIYVTF
ncbi:LAMI_0H03422g1_1 [Lachancea mirantina]|uniref:LAMI_0H03422g1_1 n=1 Tax=Lachancea mirantina TaxID=1230905 RepID=A0A1G4KEB2_9SACH|nr:LAMI_0H03422g1_1 [Lachancea mirantina]